MEIGLKKECVPPGGIAQISIWKSTLFGDRAYGFLGRLTVTFRRVNRFWTGKDGSSGGGNWWLGPGHIPWWNWGQNVTRWGKETSATDRTNVRDCILRLSGTWARQLLSLRKNGESFMAFKKRKAKAGNCDFIWGTSQIALNLQRRRDH